MKLVLFLDFLENFVRDVLGSTFFGFWDCFVGVDGVLKD